MKKRVTFDFETRSACDLKKSGAYKYSLDPTTSPTCLAAKFHGKDIRMFLRFEEVNKPFRQLEIEGNNFTFWWKNAIEQGYEFSAHNAFFERCIYRNILVARYGWPDIPDRLWRCTAAKAASCALPRNLQGAGEAMDLPVQKDRRGYVAVMKTCKPTKEWAKWAELEFQKEAWDRNQRRAAKRMYEPPMFLEYNDDPETWEVLYEYCKIDVKAEECLDDALPDLNPREQEIWFLNQQLNWRGLRVDIASIRKIVSIMETESKSRLKELDALTMGLVTKAGARRSILEFLALDGIKLPDIRAKTVDDALDGGKLTEDGKRLLEIRKALSKTSTKKYQSFLHRASDDGRVRDILLYHGASTGRDTGTGIQPHNFPRGAIRISKERPYAAIENVIECDEEMLRLLYGPNLSILFSSILRNMIIPSDGNELFVADFSKIEVAVLWWLSENWPGLKILNEGKDPYKYMAAANTGRDYDEIPDEGDDRQLGKAQVLGCGFGMGWGKFQTTAWEMYRLKLTEEQSRFAVGNYREANEAVPILWKAYERACVEAIENNVTVEIGKCRFFVHQDFLWIELPSRRRLAYRKPEMSWRETDFGPRKTIEFWAVNSKTKKWSKERTWGGTLTENIVQAVARDLMMTAMVRLERNGYKALLMVHDEALTEKPIGEGNLEEFVKIMCKRPSWADEHLPLDAKAWKGPRYRK